MARRPKGLARECGCGGPGPVERARLAPAPPASGAAGCHPGPAGVDRRCAEFPDGGYPRILVRVLASYRRPLLGDRCGADRSSTVLVAGAARGAGTRRNPGNFHRGCLRHRAACGARLAARHCARGCVGTRRSRATVYRHGLSVEPLGSRLGDPGRGGRRVLAARRLGQCARSHACDPADCRHTRLRATGGRDRGPRPPTLGRLGRLATGRCLRRSRPELLRSSFRATFPNPANGTCTSRSRLSITTLP